MVSWGTGVRSEGDDGLLPILIWEVHSACHDVFSEDGVLSLILTVSIKPDVPSDTEQRDRTQTGRSAAGCGQQGSSAPWIPEWTPRMSVLGTLPWGCIAAGIHTRLLWEKVEA